MAMASFKVDFPRRQAMLTIREPHYKGNGIVEYDEVARVPVFVWPNPTMNGLFVVEHQDGTVQRVQPDSLTFLGSKELFDQYDWNDEQKTCKNVGGYWNAFECSECGCEVSGGDELGHNSSEGAFKFCPNCGRKVSDSE